MFKEHESTEQSRSNLKKCCLGRLFIKLKEEKVIKEQSNNLLLFIAQNTETER